MSHLKSIGSVCFLILCIILAPGAATAIELVPNGATVAGQDVENGRVDDAAAGRRHHSK